MNNDGKHSSQIYNLFNLSNLMISESESLNILYHKLAIIIIILILKSLEKRT